MHPDFSKNEGSMVQTCQKMNVVNTEIYVETYKNNYKKKRIAKYLIKWLQIYSCCQKMGLASPKIAKTS